MPDVLEARVTELRCRRRRDLGACYETVGLAVLLITNRALLVLNSYLFQTMGTSTFQVQLWLNGRKLGRRWSEHREVDKRQDLS